MANRTIIAISVFGICAMGILAGCGGKTVKVIHKEQQDLVAANYKAVDSMLKIARTSVGSKTPILVATFVDLDDVTRTSALGRVMGEMCAARLTQRGYKVINLKVRADSVVIKSGQGEFLLSRDVNALSRDYGAQVVLIGTYTRTSISPKLRSVNQQWEELDPELLTRPSYTMHEKRIFESTDDTVYVSIRLVNAKDHSVLAAFDYRIICDEGVESLLVSSEDDSYMRY